MGSGLGLSSLSNNGPMLQNLNDDNPSLALLSSSSGGPSLVHDFDTSSAENSPISGTLSALNAVANSAELTEISSDDLKGVLCEVGSFTPEYEDGFSIEQFFPGVSGVSILRRGFQGILRFYRKFIANDTIGTVKYKSSRNIRVTIYSNRNNLFLSEKYMLDDNNISFYLLY